MMVVMVVLVGGMGRIRSDWQLGVRLFRHWRFIDREEGHNFIIADISEANPSQKAAHNPQ